MATIAAFRSGETDRLARSVGFEVAVLAVVSDADAFAASLSRNWHGAYAPRERWFAAFDNYDAMPWTVRFARFAMDERWMGDRELPPDTWVEDGALKIMLAPGGRVAAFEAAFAATMADFQFDRIAARPGEVQWRFRTGRPLVVSARYSKRPWFPVRAADDIYAFRPRTFRHLVGRACEARAIVNVQAALASTVRRQEPAIAR